MGTPRRFGVSRAFDESGADSSRLFLRCTCRARKHCICPMCSGSKHRPPREQPGHDADKQGALPPFRIIPSISDSVALNVSIFPGLACSHACARHAPRSQPRRLRSAAPGVSPSGPTPPNCRAATASTQPDHLLHQSLPRQSRHPCYNTRTHQSCVSQLHAAVNSRANRCLAASAHRPAIMPGGLMLTQR
jgi:hypothetical protein